jgi:Periplasmic binding protein
VAVDGESDQPSNAPRTKLSGFQPNVEAIAGYRPDLVVISDESPASLAPALRKLDIPVIVNPAARSLGQAYLEIEQLGLATGRDTQARNLVRRMKSQIAASVRSADGWGRSLSVYDEISQEYYAAASGTLAGQLFSLFGLRDIADRAPDVGRQQDVLDLVGELRGHRSLTVIGAIHDLTLAGQYADELLLLDHGCTAATGPPGTVLCEPLLNRHYRARLRVGAPTGHGLIVTPRPPVDPPARSTSPPALLPDLPVLPR